MLKRVTWLSVGFVAGAGASKWLERKARRRLARYLPGGRVSLEAGAEMKDRAVRAARGTFSDVRQAVDEGRLAMVDRESTLRRQLRLVPPAADAPAPGDDGRPPPGIGRRRPA